MTGFHGDQSRHCNRTATTHSNPICEDMKPSAVRRKRIVEEQAIKDGMKNPAPRPNRPVIKKTAAQLREESKQKRKPHGLCCVEGLKETELPRYFRVCPDCPKST